MSVGKKKRTDVDALQEKALQEKLLRRRLGGGRPRGRRSAVTPVDRSGTLRLSFGQQQMWFLNRLEPDSAEYLVPLAFRVRGKLDTPALERAWSALIARHEVLRTRYALADGEPSQIIDPPSAVALPLDLRTGASADERERHAAEFVTRMSAVPFDLEHEWPVRARLLRLADDDHILSVVLHHIAFDAWSTRVLVTELGALYEEFRNGREPSLPALPVQYADYAAWQRAEESGGAFARHVDHWREQLADITPLDLPTDLPRPSHRRHEGADVPFALPDGLSEKVHELALKHNATPFAVLLPAFQALLARYTGRRDIPVGTVVSGRTRPELQGLIGYGINNLVMRARWTGDPSFAELIEQARENLIQAYEHQAVPFARLVDELQPERDMSRTPLYEVAFTLHERGSEGVELPGLSIEPVTATGGVAKCDLELQVNSAADGTFQGQLVYSTSLFERDTVRRMVQHFVRFLQQVVEDETTRLSRVDILDEAEHALVAGRPHDECPVTRTVHELFEERAARTPGAVAVIADGESLTYAELDARANRLAHHLRTLGTGPEHLVGVCLPRGTDLMPTLLGVLKSGAAYLPLDPANPTDRLAYILNDAGATAVITETDLLPLVQNIHDGPFIVLDRDQDRQALAAQPATAPTTVSGPDNAIYVIYTSGSTGRPKGVTLTHTNVARLLTAAQEHYAFDDTDVWTMTHSYAFDVSVFEMWGALLNGGTLVVVDQDTARSPDDLLDLLVEHQVTVLSQTPTAFRSLVTAAADNDPRIPRLTLRHVVFAGEKLELAELTPWTERLGLDTPALINMYGITETTVHTTYHQVTAADLDAAGNPVGHPLSDLRVHLLDSHGNLVPLGVPGEIHVGGPGVARGYLNRPELTAERFVPDPFGPPGTRLYRSGDLARRRPDGTLDFLGRADDQVKIRGYRIELGEIETTLTTHPHIRDAVVIAREDTPGDKRLVGYLVPADEAAPETADLREFLGRGLPDYMVPAAFVTLDALPLTANGKLDKRALPAPGQDAFARSAYLAPRTPAEERIAAVWATALEVDRVGVHDSFFDLGGDSIRAVALVGALRDEGFDLSVRDVFDRRTVAELGELLTGRATVPADQLTLVEPFELISDEDRASLPDGIVDAYPLSQIQTGMVIEMLADEEKNHYHNCSCFRILDDRPFDFGAFQQAVAQVVERHDMLRTSVHLTDFSVPLQLVHEHAEAAVGVRDLSQLDEDELQAALQEFVHAERAAPFDLNTPTLMRFHAHVTGDTVWWISVTECHPIMEGWSYHSLLMELLSCYRRIRDGREPEPYERPAVRFADSIAGELASLASAEDRAFWRRITGDYEKFTLPSGWGDDSGAPRVKHHVQISWEDLEPRLRALATKARASLKSVMLAAYGKVMSGLTDARTFHAGLVFDVRPEVTGADQVYGMYLNTLPLAFDRMPATWLELVRATFAREVGTWEHRRHPLPAVQREIGGTQRLIDVFFNYQDFRQVDAALVDDRVGIDDSPTEFPLTISSRVKHIFLTADSWSLTLENTERVGAMFRTVLEAMAADADGDARVPLIPAEEHERLVGEWAVNPAEPVTTTVFELFEEQALRSPDALAVVAGDERLTYAELDARANRLAHRLRELGVGSESVVGVLLDRGADLVVGLLAVWKAGGAYLPMDPVFPAERVTHMLADAGAGVLLTQSAHQEWSGDGFGGRTLLVDRDRASVDAQPSSAPDRVADPDRLAYVIYTSGSTGRPKGVLVPHGGLANHVRWAVRELTGAGGGAPLFSSIAFDLVVPNLWAPLLAGQPVHVLPQDLDLGRLGEALAAGAPYAFVKLTPAHLEVLTHQLSADQARRLAPLLVVAGEAFRRQAVRSWRELAPDTVLVNEYGPTENSVGTSTWPVPESAPGGTLPEVMPIGRPLPGVAMYVLDERLQPVPAGVAGELYVGGTGVARGYLGRPELTAGRFVPDPFGPPGGRLYRTGDIVRLLPDGSVDFLGRGDGQIKIRGYRVELGEIEAALVDHPRVSDARVLLREDAPGDKRLVAYLVPDGESAPDPAELHTLLGRTLPEYMVPSAFVVLESIPLNANGKVDRRALPAPGEDAYARVEYTAPRTPLEERVTAVWGQVLDDGRLGVHDDFFDLGGDSIRAVALVGALRGEGLDVAVRDVFAHRTVAGLCELLSGRSALTAGERAFTAPFALISGGDRARLPEGVVDAYPLSLVQTGMLVETLADQERGNYHNVNVYRVHDDQPFDADAFSAAVGTVVARNEALRTSVALTGYSVPLQLVHADVEVPVAVRDLRGLTEERQRRSMTAYVADERARVFDLAGPEPLLRVAAHVLGSDWLCTFTQSHAVMDGWSNQLFLVDLVRVYRRLRDGLEPEPYDAPGVRFADSIAAELAALESEDDRAYWDGVVTGHAKAGIPTGWHGDLAEPAGTVRAGVRFGDLEEPLRALAGAARTSVKSVLVAAFVKVVGQLTDAPAYHAGLVTHCRPEASGSDRIYGTYLNTLPFPADRSARTWRELVRQMSDREIEAWPHRHFPMPAIARPDGGRLVDVFFSYLDFHRMDSEEAEDGWGFNDAPNEFALTVTALGGVLSLRSTSHVLSQANADRIAGMFRAVLEAMAADADGDARAVYLPEGERDQLLAAGRAAAPSAPVTRTVHELFEERAARTPDAVAVITDGQSLTYAELDARANRLAHHLRTLGTGPEHLVGVCLPRGTDLMPTLLGVLKSGAAYLPLDPANPTDRLAYILNDAGATAVITETDLLPLVQNIHDGPFIVLDRDEDRQALAAEPATAPTTVSGPDNAIYVIYTSGSTGRPKGVTLTHTNVARLLTAAQEHYAFDDTDVWTMTHSYAFDVSVFEMWGALLNGGTLVVVDQDTARSPDDLLDLLVEHQVTVLSQTPTAFRSLVTAAADNDPRIPRLTLRHVVFAGEKLELAELTPWTERLGLEAPALVNMYGITETTVHTTYHRITKQDLAPGAGNPIGRPLSDLTVHLLDPYGNLVPLGVPGEIHVGGPGVARGYLNRPELTAERFVPDPFGPPGTRLYRSGDLARHRPDGTLDFLGRADDQVKIRGYRIELGEIETTLTTHPDIRDAVVIAREDTPGDKRLVAYCVMASDAASPSGAELAARCGLTLPDYMVPAAFVTLDALPLTANGKLDKRALPAPGQDAFARSAYVAPRTPAEERIAAVWRDVLRVDTVGVHDSFFDLGGDSIKAVALVGALREELLDVSVGDVFAHRTVGELGGLLAGRAGLATGDERVEPFALISDEDRAKLPAGLADAYPMSQVQTGMVVEMLGGGDAYRSFMSYRISDSHAFSEEALREAARTVVGRHEMLRTSFDLHSCSLPMQLVHAEVDVPVTVHRVPATASGAEGAPSAELMSLLGAERDAEFDLSRAPLLRVAAYVGQDTEAGWWLSIARPHAITEGWSHNWLLAELTGVYRRLRDGLEPEPYDAPSVRYADYIAAELASLESEEDAAYWRNVVDTHAPFTLPDGWDREAGAGESYDLKVPLDDIEDSLRALATRLRVSVKSVLLAAHVKVMSQLTESPAFQVGLVCDARPELTGADRVYGMHLNTVPFPADRSARTWRELVTQVFDRETELWPHRRYPFPAMQRDRHGGRLVNVAFNYVDLPRLGATAPVSEPDGGIPGDARADARFGVSRTEFDITLHCRGDRLNLTTDTAVLSRADGERLRGMYRAVLEAMVDDADGDARATYLPDGERRLLLDQLTTTGRDPVSLRVPEEFQRRAAAAPDAVAVVTDDSVTTYQELNARANRLAHRLRELGVGPDVVVGICLERSPELVLSVLAVLKAGGAYLPLDPEAPAERLGFMLEDAAVRLVLTRRDLADTVRGDDERGTVLLDDERTWSGQPSADPEPTAADDDLAYVIYTSGSTGRPKGAMVRRDGMGNHLLAKTEDLGLGPTDGVVFNAPPAFDISVWQMLAALVTGGRVRVVGGDTALDPSGLFGRVADEGITVLEVVPSLLRTSLDFWDAGAPAPGLPLLRRLVVTGEALPAELCDRWLDRYPDIPLVNAYGPTECSDDVTHALVSGPPGEGRVPIGEPVRNTRLYVLDEWLQPVPVGVAGELYVGGAGVGRGYLNRSALTAERFLPDPFGPPGARLYRTGDLAAWRADRSLDFLGRVDDQVKIRGHRVELGEIEAAFGAHPDVRQAVVLVRDERLVGYFTALDERPLPPEELRERLARTLPDYMLPTAFVQLAAIPLTPNGKVDKRALPAPDDESFVRGEYVAPRTESERRVAEIWRDALGVERVGVRDGFFDLGGDSIRAVALVGALRAEGIDIAVRDVLQARTVERLCELVADRDGLAPADQEFTEPFALISDEDRAKLPEDVVDAYPVGRTQLGMLIEMMDGERNPYHIINTFRVADDQPLDPDALRRAAAVLAARHEVLRTSFRLTGYSTPLQLVHATAEIPVRVHDVRGRSEEELTAVRFALMRGERAESFAIDRAPLFRIVAHDEGDDAWWVTFTQSHAITEGWSYHQLLVELLDCYRAIRDGADPEPYDLPRVRFADAIAAELVSLRSADDQAYWRRITSGYVPVTLPAEWAGETDEPLYNEVPFDDLGDRLRKLAASAQVSLKSVLLAAHMKVLGQITDEPAYHAGLVVDTHPEALGADRVLGMYLNTLPFAVDRSARTWRELVTQVFDREVELWAHRRYPMPVVQHEWGGGRLINAYFNYIDFHQVDTEKVATGTRMTSAANEFDLTVFNRGDRLYVNTRDSVMNSAHARRVAGMYRAVLEAMADDADGDARAVYLPEGERERLLEAGVSGAHRTDNREQHCVHELFEEQAARTPDAVAVIADGESLTYTELDARANRLAHHLRTLGAGPEHLVGVCLPRGTDLMPTLLGVLKSGAAYLPLDPANPTDRLAYILNDAGATAVITETDLLPLVQNIHDGPFIVLDRDEDRQALAAEPATAPTTVSGPDNAIYVIYTSGSTGRPKGVTLTHTNVARLLTAAQEHYAFDDTDVWTMTHSYAFDVSVFEMWGALLNGGTLVVVPGEVTRSPDDLLDLLVEHEVTVLSQTPTAFRSLVTAAADGDRRIKRLMLRAVIFAGEKLEIGELRPWTERLGLGRVALANMYGITETTVHTTYHRITKQDLAPGAGNPIGRPLSDLTVHLLDPYGNPVPVGSRGEIHVGGPGVARGYLNRPELTAERFVPDPFGPPGTRLYRSGDLARRRPDGTLDFLGRADDQVKIRGYRIELGEIETTLTTHPDIRDAVVIAREDTPGDKRLVGYLVPADDRTPVPAELRELLGRTLPEYMVPAAYQVIDRIPLTANGKLDKRALPAPGQDAYARSAYLAPRTPAEERIAAVWRDALRVDTVGVHDSFFELGGDSIKAVVIAGEMSAAGVEVTAREVLEHRTIDALCARTAGGTVTTAPATVEPFALLTEADRARLPEGLVDAYPLTQAQNGMLVEMLSGDGPMNYHRVSSVRIGAAEPFSREPLQRALSELVSRHDPLRSRVDTESYSVPMQLVHATAEVPLRVVDLTSASTEEQDRALRELVAAESRTPLPHDTAPLLRLVVHRFADGDWQITVTQSHLIMDGWTFGVFRAELLDLYRTFRDGLPVAPYDPPAVRFADTVAAELRALASAEDRAYWTGVVGDHARFALPSGWGDPDGPDDRHRTRVPLHDLLDGLRAVASDAGAPLKSVLLAAHLKVLSQLTPERRFFTGLVTHCRPEAPGADRVYGSHLNPLPFPVDLSAATWRELVRQVRDREIEAWPHRHFPTHAIQHDLGDGSRLLDVRFSYHDFAAAGAGVAAPAASGDNSGFSRIEVPLGVSTVEGCLELNADSAFLSRTELERLTAMYRAVLESIAAGGDGDTRTVFHPPGERDQLIGPWATAAGEPVEPVSWTAPQAWRDQVARTPDAVALATDDTTMSCAELDVRANRIAHHLRAAGVGAESVVGVLLERGTDLMATLLGVWKAGGAYLPLDPSFPAGRLRDMLADAGADVLVTASDLAGPVAFDGPHVLMDRDREALAALPGTAPEQVTDPDSLAYVICTSGSTGRPKGVQVTHRGLANYLRWALSAYLAGGGGGAPLFSSIAFDLVVPNLWAPLLAGQPVRLLPEDTDLDTLGQRLLDGGPYGFVKLTPGHLEVLSQQIAPERLAEVAGVVVVAGEALPVPLADTWARALGAGRLLNSYGPTETTVASSGCAVDTVLPARRAGGTIPVGRPIPGARLLVLDGHLEPVPRGTTGELYIGGTGVARGYAGRPDPTADRFVPDPYGPPGGRLYRTGDLARTLADGSVEFLGRADDQIKIRGYRVEPGDIERVLVTHPDIAEARVVLREGTSPSAGSDAAPGDGRLVAYVTAAPGGAPEPGDLRDWAGGSLPSYMVPGVFVRLEKMPLTANGKLDRAALPDPDDQASARAPFVAPRTPVERTLAAIWAETLQVDRVGVHDRFFALGGHSIVVFKVIAAARRAGVPLSLLTIYQDDSLEAVAAAAEAASESQVVTPSAQPPAAQTPAVERPDAATGPLHGVENVPGVSIAVIRDGELVSVEAHGVLAAGGTDPVTPETVFQVGSLSKHITALGVLRLVDQRVLDLDEDVNAYLRNWRVPDGFRITLRQLLGHLSGLAPTPVVHLPRGQRAPSLTDLLHGRGPGVSAPARAELEPGQVFRKANVHYSVVQQVLEDATGRPFAELMDDVLLKPLGLTGSSFDPAFPETTDRPVALGHDPAGRPVEGGWLTRPEPAAAGLWTTATDLAKAALEIRRARLARPLALLTADSAREMLTAQHLHSSYGLGTVVDDLGADVQFGHGGGGAGYHSLAMCRVGPGRGFVVLTNGESGAEVAKRHTSLLEPDESGNRSR
ncbi:non-ribosomal peptide synthase/polyketide synthase [Streptomyces sp. DSM 40750]|uniref:non-ribosomal peptide synthase/polyketide synthase n=1 Tax=Streptomyces sp. DSM 40750 TaxID=2801030 RepID=UPI00214AE093|nr:non-ribosomal peptide synthase/polyketide synthase [Streptomyces sp. DSM 40750]UUU22854.1 non-ribosomal peptide synthase/polyketide synthase [Streptomyces sp. DSM 40750]